MLIAVTRHISKTSKIIFMKPREIQSLQNSQIGAILFWLLHLNTFCLFQSIRPSLAFRCIAVMNITIIRCMFRANDFSIYRGTTNHSSLKYSHIRSPVLEVTMFYIPI